MEIKKDFRKYVFTKLIIATVIIGIACAILGDALKLLTDHYENSFFERIQQHPILFFIFPFIGLSLIYILRQSVFKRKENKGIKEIYDSLKTRHNELPVYKIPSHFINGLLTVAFGGSTGIEVATVVASASIGSVTQNKANIHSVFRKELICAGVAAGVTALFNSPVAGVLFALEVISKKFSWPLFISVAVASFTVWAFNFVLHTGPLFNIPTDHWNQSAFPYFIILGIMAGLNGVYLTKCVLYFKSRFAFINQHSVKILSGSLFIGCFVFLFPQLYGDGYHSIRTLIANPASIQFTYAVGCTFLCVLIFKPIVTSLTLASGGDGGIFAPSLFIGAFLGFFIAILVNHFFDAAVIPANFMVIGMAAVLSASLHAPFTAVFLACGLVGNYTLMIPVITACLISKLTAKRLVPYTVYNYMAKK